MANKTFLISSKEKIDGVDGMYKYRTLQDLGQNFTSYAGREYEPQTQNTFAFQWLFDEYQVEWIARRVGGENGGFKPGIVGANDNLNIVPVGYGSGKILDQYSQNLSVINHVLNNSMQSLTSPTKSVAAIVIDYFNAQVKFAGKPTFNNASITFNTLIGLRTKNILEAWSSLVQDETTLRGGWARSVGSENANASTLSALDDQQLYSRTGYKVDGILLECARDGTIINQWDYVGMWISDFTPGSYNMSGSNTPSQVSATITVDMIRKGSISISDNIYLVDVTGQSSATLPNSNNA